MESAWQALKLLAGFAVVIGLAFWGTRLLGPRTGISVGGRHVKIVEVVSLGHNRLICLVKVGSGYLLLGVSDHAICNLGDYDVLEPLDPEETSRPDFIGSLAHRSLAWLRKRG